MNILVRFFLGWAVSFAAGALAAAPVARGLPEFDTWVDAYSQDWMRSEPLAATRAQYLPRAEQDLADRTLSGPDGYYSIDASAIAARAALAQRGLDELRRFPRSELAPGQRVSRDVLSWELGNAIAVAQVARSLYVFEQFGGIQVSIVNFLTQVHPLRNPRDADNYLARLAEVSPLLDRAIAEARFRADHGVVPPKFILASTLGGLDRLLAPPPEGNVFVTTFAERTALLKNYPAADRQAAIERARTITAESIYPAFARVRGLLTEQSQHATDDAGLWKVPHGDEVYAKQLASHTTTKLTAAEIHAIGLREVTRIEGEMDTLLRALGYLEGSVKERYLKLNATMIPPETPDPRGAILAEFARIVREAQVRAPEYFDLIPKAPVEVRREPAFTEAGAAAHYSLPAPDGSKPGIFFAPLANLNADSLWMGAGMKTVAYHEAVPGHHYQMSLQQELPGLPRFRKFLVVSGLAAFTEGWGLYSERLADEAGWYEGDPRSRLGYLNAQLFRARRLVVDTGLHAMKWTRQQAIDYGIQASEVERYVVYPGQACSYMIGFMRIYELRQKAEATLGAKFSIKEYHNLLLRTGAVPLDVLTEVVDDWIAHGGKTAE